MTKVFIGGSRRTSRLNTHIRERLDGIMERGGSIIVGDANGADKALQEYLHGKHYRNVEIFCTEGVCRNNIGNWPKRDIPANTSKRDAQFYSVKDRAMAQEATTGIMMWDGQSVGTLLNIFRLLMLDKKAVLYAVKEKRFLEFNCQIDWEIFLQKRDMDLQKNVEKRKKLEPGQVSNQIQMSFVER